MANYIDEKFYALIKEFEKNEFYNIYKHMVQIFKHIPLATQDSLEKYFNKYPYWGEFNTKQENYEVYFKKAKVFKENFQEYVWLYENLNDYRSKFLLFSILNNFYNFDFQSLRNATDNIFKQYFELDLLPTCKDEVFVDVGSYIGDSVRDFVNSYGKGSYKKIYCYEITKSIISQSKKNLADLENIEFRNKAVANNNGELFVQENANSLSANMTSNTGKEKIESVKLDDDIKEPVSIIKMDIEGGEQNAIRGSVNHIEKDLPKLFLSVYHNNTDLFEIPRMITNITQNYNLYLRYYGGCVYPTEIVLICLPKQN